ncbi:MAG: dihydroorotate dehydrogenase [Spirochaetales bacterium]|nr:dihydroorotate dehydrogenase [Spirochaetales bacterium]
MDLSTNIGSLKLNNPVGTASGTFGYGYEYEGLLDFTKLGAIYTKAITLHPRQGNPLPRIVETDSGMINSIGLANVGLEKFITDKIPGFPRLGSKIIVNVAGSSPEEYKAVVETLSEIEQIHGFEINLSCPNVKQGCLAFGTDPRNVENLTRQLKALTKKPIIIKLTPNVTDITAIAIAAEAGGADAVSCINTLVGMKIDIKKKDFCIAMKTGGLSGPAIKPVGVAAVYKVSKAVKIPVVGIGGIAKWEDAVEYLLAGASSIQIGTYNFVEPAIVEEIHDGIATYMQENNIATIKDFHSILD